MSTYEVSGFTCEPFKIKFSGEVGLDAKEIFRRAAEQLKGKEILFTTGVNWNEREAYEITRMGKF